MNQCVLKTVHRIQDRNGKR